jgi:hypothetical protein
MKLIGDLSNKKIEKLHEELKSFLPIVNRLQFGYIFANEETGMFLVILDKQVILETRGSEEKFNRNQVHEIIKIVFDVLLLDEETQVILDVIGTVKDVKSTFNKSLAFINNINDNMDEIYGVGYKLFIKNEEYIGELRIEPLVKDDTYFYIEYIMSSKGKNKLERILEDVEKMLHKELKDKLYNNIVKKIIN